MFAEADLRAAFLDLSNQRLLRPCLCLLLHFATKPKPSPGYDQLSSRLAHGFLPNLSTATLIFFFPTWPPFLSVFPLAPGVTSFKMCIWKNLSSLPALWTFQAKFLAWPGCHPLAQHRLLPSFSSLSVLSCGRAFAPAAAFVRTPFLPLFVW